VSARSIYSTEPTRGWLPWAALAPFLGVLFVAIPLVGVSSVLEHLQLADAKGDPIGLSGFFAVLLFPFALVGLIVLAWVRFVERRPLATIGLTRTDGTRAFLRGHAIGIATSFAVVAAIWVAGGLTADGVARAFRSPGALPGIAALLFCFAVQASVEEVLFRGWLLSALAGRVPVSIAVFLASLVFAFLHWSPRQHALDTVNIFLFSLFTCAWALKAGNIWGVMGWHSGWNWLLATGFELPVTGLDAKLPALIAKLTASGPTYLTGGAQGPEGSLACTLFFACAIALLAWGAKRSRHAEGHVA
jgi:hypothetical protein